MKVEFSLDINYGEWSPFLLKSLSNAGISD